MESNFINTRPPPLPSSSSQLASSSVSDRLASLISSVRVSKMGRYNAGALLLCLLMPVLLAESRIGSVLKMPTDPSGLPFNGDDDAVGTRWAVLIAGSSGYGNYRHQADVCHAYQIMKSGGLKDENIIVFMFDDIAYNVENPRQGIIINHPQGGDVYTGVPKDYVGTDVNVGNFFAVILGNKTALTGGSGKVVDSGPDDHIFIFYTDHGGPGVLGMPTYPYLYADDLIAVLKKKHEMGTYKNMVFYLEACESGSIFEGLLPDDVNIYATTASNAEESSWGTYCPGEIPSPPPGYYTCLGDLYSVSWMEDSERRNLRAETLKQQYELVKERTAVHDVFSYGSHVMQYGELDINAQHIYLYMGSDPVNDNITFINDNSLPSLSKAVNQRDADLLYLWHKFQTSPEGSPKKREAQKELLDIMSHRLHVDNSLELIGKVLFGSEKGSQVLKTIRPAGQPLVNDWNCLKSLVRTFETYCGSLSQYGMKHMRSLANFCNAGVTTEAMADASSQACMKFPSNPWSSIQMGFSA